MAYQTGAQIPGSLTGPAGRQRLFAAVSRRRTGSPPAPPWRRARRTRRAGMPSLYSLPGLMAVLGRYQPRCAEWRSSGSAEQLLDRARPAAQLRDLSGLVPRQSGVAVFLRSAGTAHPRCLSRSGRAGWTAPGAPLTHRHRYGDEAVALRRYSVPRVPGAGRRRTSPPGRSGAGLARVRGESQGAGLPDAVEHRRVVVRGLAAGELHAPQPVGPVLGQLVAVEGGDPDEVGKALEM